MGADFIIVIAGEIFTLGLLIVGVITLRHSLRKEREAKIASDAVLAESVAQLKVKLDKETGGNSGGMREAINAILATQRDEASKSSVTSSLVHELAGQMREHTELHRLGNSLR